MPSTLTAGHRYLGFVRSRYASFGVFSIQRNVRSVHKKVRNERKSQNARIKAVIVSAAFVTLHPLLSLRYVCCVRSVE